MYEPVYLYGTFHPCTSCVARSRESQKRAAVGRFDRLKVKIKEDAPTQSSSTAAPSGPAKRSRTRKEVELNPGTTVEMLRIQIADELDVQPFRVAKLAVERSVELGVRY